ncbi:Clp protease [Rathayibacter sp. AY1B1]|uniref:SRPBCC family protein n=1 Tax=unclassified Rathayibacter TaxID=2609250 RepID=UPI000CE73BE9|nr:MULTISPECIES: Clp protease N-terminal domain-containing protein [unclassified Rathayibacter]PPI19699.1 Clp protease [Rathayibacter sp. AY1B6]PPI34328.1 Clp protease [Rathayibacter sp. AY1B1]
MSKLARVAQTTQSLSLAAMEEASRAGLRVADLEHLFLALVINDQPAGEALRGMGIDLDAARRAVEEQHAAQLASLGIRASFPDTGRIVFHETAGYEWSRRAMDLITRSSGRKKGGDAAAVLRDLVSEPSGLIADILRRLGTSPGAVLEQLDRFDAPVGRTVTTMKGRVSASTETFVPAPIEEVWEFLADPARVPDWEMIVGSIDRADQDVAPGAVWHGRARGRLPDGKPMKVKPQFSRRRIELVAAHRPDRIAWSFAYPDVPHSSSLLTDFTVVSTTGGARVRIVRSWSLVTGWRRLVAFPLRPLQRFFAWITVFQTGSAISRTFR